MNYIMFLKHTGILFDFVQSKLFDLEETNVTINN